MKQKKKILVVQVAALSWDIIKSHSNANINGLQFYPADSVFPAVTCTVQASFRTGMLPAEHGMVANGLFYRQLKKVMFWEQSAAQVAGQRIWDEFRDKGGTVGMMFWQQSLGENVDAVISPAPIHKHHGGMIQDCYSRPADTYQLLCNKLKKTFNLMHYWGPLASAKSSQWITDATCAMIAGKINKAPDLLFTYLPGLDYDLQRFGPGDARTEKSKNMVLNQIKQLVEVATDNGYEILVFGDYAIVDCNGGAVYPNKALRDADLLSLRKVKNMHYVDLYNSRAFAVVDHEIAHIHIARQEDIPVVAEVLRNTPGIEIIMDEEAKKKAGVLHPAAGELMAVAEDGYWMSYRWWDAPGQAPDYAAHVDIHNKPGFDPCELFFGWPPGSVSSNDNRVGGTHGKTGHGRKVACASSCIDSLPDNLIDLSAELKTWLGK